MQKQSQNPADHPITLSKTRTRRYSIVLMNVKVNSELFQAGEII